MSDDRMRKILEGLGERKATSDSQERKAAEIRAKMEQKRIDTINAIDDQKRLASRLVEQMNERIEATGYLMRYEYLPQPDLDYAGVIVVTVAQCKISPKRRHRPGHQGHQRHRLRRLRPWRPDRKLVG